MEIQAILAAKGGEVHTIEPDTDAVLATGLMKIHRVAALVVIQDDQVVGLVGERDIVHAVAARRGSIAGMKVREIMERNPTTCSSGDLISKVMEVMTLERRRHLPVVDDGRLCGIVSIGDMVKFRLDDMELESKVLRDAYLGKG